MTFPTGIVDQVAHRPWPIQARHFDHWIGLWKQTASALMPAAEAATRNAFPSSNPEALGISTDAILAFAEGAERRFGGLHSFALLRHGNESEQLQPSPPRGRAAPRHRHSSC